MSHQSNSSAFHGIVNERQTGWEIALLYEGDQIVSWAMVNLTSYSYSVNAWTREEHRGKGYISKLLKALLEHHKIKKNDPVFTFSRTLLRILNRLGWKKHRGVRTDRTTKLLKWRAFPEVITQEKYPLKWEQLQQTSNGLRTKVGDKASILKGPKDKILEVSYKKTKDGSWKIVDKPLTTTHRTL